MIFLSRLTLPGGWREQKRKGQPLWVLCKQKRILCGLMWLLWSLMVRRYAMFSTWHFSLVICIVPIIYNAPDHFYCLSVHQIEDWSRPHADTTLFIHDDGVYFLLDTARSLFCISDVIESVAYLDKKCQGGGLNPN